MENQEKKELTPMQHLVMINSHIDNNIRCKCGPDADEGSWNINEISNIIMHISHLNKALEHYEVLKDQQGSSKSTVKEPVKNKAPK
tara:strand:+ start:399 stop:656 length:258 start_codon:yes stop_codon:yes gene_type:complete